MYPDIEALGEWNAAVDAHLAAASSSASIPLASVLGHTYAARSHDALGQFDRALGEYQTALAGWNTDYGTVYSLHRTQNRGAYDRVGVQARADVARVELPGRLEQLRRATSLPGGTLLEKGRSLVEQRRHAEALVFMTAGGQAVLSDIVASLGSKPTDNRNPVIAELEFLDAARTRAAARIVGRSEGGTVILEKDRGVWVAREVVNRWIS